MKVLITGINGFVGKYLEKILIEKGYRVYGIDLKNNNRENIFECDLKDSKRLESIILETEPEFIFHLAAISKTTFQDFKEIYEINVNGTLNLLNSCLKLEKKPKIIFISSSHVYGNVSSKKIKETTLTRPYNHYGASKLKGEALCWAFFNQYNLPILILRAFNHTGPSQPIDFLIPKLINCFKNRLPTINLGNIDITREFIDVRDVVNIYVKVIENYIPGKVYNVSSGRGYKISSIIKLLQKITSHKPNIVISKELIRENEPAIQIGDNTELMKVINYKFNYDIKKTLVDMINN